MKEQEKHTAFNKILSESGNVFHYKVVNYFREQQDGWNIEVSPYYEDQYTGVPREIDIAAHKVFQMEGGKVEIRLFIECKYIKDNIVTGTWFDKRNVTLTNKLIQKSTGIIWSERVHKHHYSANEKVAKLFSTATSDEKNESKITVGDDRLMFKAIGQSLHALRAFRPNKPTSKHVVRLPGSSESYKKVDEVIVCYPLIVVNDLDQFFVIPSKKGQYQKSGDFFQIEVNYASKENETEYFIIDVVSFKGLTDYIKLLDSDVQELGYLMSQIPTL